jgi:hypothetical protein
VNPSLQGPRCDLSTYAGHIVSCARRFAHIGWSTNWQNERFDCVDRPEFHDTIPEQCWYDQAVYGSLLVPVVAWANGDGTFSGWPLAGRWPSLSTVRNVLDEVNPQAVFGGEKE